MTQTEEIAELRAEVARLRRIEEEVMRVTVRQAYNFKCNDCDEHAVTDFHNVFVCAVCYLKRMHELEVNQ